MSDLRTAIQALGSSAPRTHRHRFRAVGHLPLVAADALLVCLAYSVALALRFDGQPPVEHWQRLPAFLLLAVVVYVALHGCLGLYGPLWVQAGAREAGNLVVGSAVATTALTGTTLLGGDERALPLSVPLTAGALGLLMLGGVRFSQRLLAARGEHAHPGGDGTPVVVVGAPGQVRLVLAQMRSQPAVGLRAVAVVTDKCSAWGRTILDVPFDGPVESLPAVVRRWGAQQVLLVRTGTEENEPDIGRLTDLAHLADVPMKVMPSLFETSGRTPRLKDIRDVSIEDLLGRPPIDIDDAAVRRAIAGRRVLVTGAGGSIGSEIVAQLSLLGAADLVLLDHDETHLHDAMARLHGPARAVLGDIRDEAFVMQLFAQARPDVVFHAAAHKHVPILESFPCEAVRTNVLGTDVLIRAALRYGTGRFVAISTDKAVNPSSVMGATKRLAEQLVLQRPGADQKYCVVRFGNVLGSRGSVVPTFLQQARSGGPLTVTHPDMTRFFMTTREAVQLVLQAAASSEGGELFMLDMGEPVRIVDLAERIIDLTASRGDGELKIEFTGLRPGEKLVEELASGDESVEETTHPKIRRVRSPLVPSEVLFPGVVALGRCAQSRAEELARDLLFTLAQPAQVPPPPEVLDLTDDALQAAHEPGGSVSAGVR